jgi:hypothetical protein
VATAVIGRLPERGEWWQYQTDPFTVEEAGPVTVWIRFDYVNENQFDTRWQADDAAIIPVQPEPEGGSLFGIVKDLHDRPVPDVRVTLQPGEWTTWTDRWGRFAFALLPEGRFTITTRRDGYTFVMSEPEVIAVAVGQAAGAEVVVRGPRGDE